MKETFNKGSELDKQIYKEGEPTWGCKSGVLDVEDVKDFIQEILSFRMPVTDNQEMFDFKRELFSSVLEKAGEKFR